MALYNYKAKTNTGEVINGKFDAVDRNMVVTLLRSKGLFPIDITEVGKMDKNIDFSFLEKVTLKDLSVFCRQFYTMVNAGVSITVCLDLLKKQTENKKLSSVIGEIADGVQKGMSLSESMKEHPKIFPNILVSMVEVGEVSGTLDIVLGRLAVHFEKENKIKSKIKTAMTYPIVIATVVFFVVIFMIVFVVPKFISMFETVGGELPTPTKILLKVADMFKNPVFLIFLALAITALIVSIKKLKETEKGRLMLDGIMLKVPVLGTNIRKLIASTFTRSLSLLLKTGVPLIQALEVLSGLIGNQIVASGMTMVKDEIRRGSNLAGPLESLGIFPPMVTQMINIGEESGSLDSTIDKVADFYDDELDEAISRLISMIEPVMMVVMAVVVGSIVVAMIMPVFEMQKNLSKVLK